MRTLISMVLWLYFLPGMLLGALQFGMRALQAAMAAPDLPELAVQIALAAVAGALRAAYWLPSLYDQVVTRGVPVLTWLLS